MHTAKLAKSVAAALALALTAGSVGCAAPVSSESLAQEMADVGTDAAALESGDVAARAITPEGVLTDMASAAASYIGGQVGQEVWNRLFGAPDTFSYAELSKRFADAVNKANVEQTMTTETSYIMADIDAAHSAATRINNGPGTANDVQELTNLQHSIDRSTSALLGQVGATPTERERAALATYVTAKQMTLNIFPMLIQTQRAACTATWASNPEMLADCIAREIAGHKVNMTTAANTQATYAAKVRDAVVTEAGDKAAGAVDGCRQYSYCASVNPRTGACSSTHTDWRYMNHTTGNDNAYGSALECAIQRGKAYGSARFDARTKALKDLEWQQTLIGTWSAIAASHAGTVTPTARLTVTDAQYGTGDVTKQIAAQCNAKESCTVTVNPDVLGDPQFNVVKGFSATYKCSGSDVVRGVSIAASADGKSVTMSCT